MRRSLITTLGLVTSVAVLAACGGDDDSSGDVPPASSDGSIGAPEKTTLQIAMSAPNVDSQAPVHIAIDKGYYDDEGLTIEIIDAQSIREGLVGGSLDLGVDNSVDLVDAAQAGTGLKIVSGWRQREPFLLAASADVTSPEDLDGEQVILGDAPGTPIIDVRLSLMAEAGFDLGDVDYQDVYPPGFSNAWVENFVSGQVKLTPLFPRHIPIIEAAGGHLVLDEWKEWPNDSLAATEGWIEDNPNTLARFLRATMKGMADWKDLDNQEYVQDLMEGKDFTVTDGERQPEIYAHGPELYDEDMGLVEEGFQATFDAQGLEMPEFESFIDVTQLHRVQEDLGITPRP